MATPTYQNSTFRSSEPVWANACVGDNGNPQIIKYANGFSTAANLLLSNVIESGGIDYPVDEFIYPICFNMRHAVELHLKGTAHDLEELANHRVGIPKFNLNGSHDIGSIWNYVLEHATALDKRYEPLTARLGPCIKDIANIDPTGQVFRYPSDTDKKKHLTKIAVINVIVLKHKFNALERLLSELHRLNQTLLEEYSWGSYTAKLSRSDLLDIVKLLPPKINWKSQEFDEIKKSVKAQYGLTGNELSKAIRIIQNNYEMAQFINATPTLLHITDTVLFAFFDIWTKLHHIYNLKRSPSIIGSASLFDGNKNILEKIKRRFKILDESWKELSLILTPERLAELKALFYFYKEFDYSEKFKEIYETEYGYLFMLNEKYPDQYKEKAFHLLDKTNALKNILHSLYFLGQIDYAENIIERYSLVNYFDWIPALRTKAKNKK